MSCDIPVPSGNFTLYVNNKPISTHQKHNLAVAESAKYLCAGYVDVRIKLDQSVKLIKQEGVILPDDPPTGDTTHTHEEEETEEPHEHTDTGNETKLLYENEEIGDLHLSNKTITFKNCTIKEGARIIIGNGIADGGELAGNKFHLTLDGDRQTQIMGHMGSRGLYCVNGGTLNFKGRVPECTWTWLDANAKKNERHIIVNDLRGWRVGDELGIGSTDYNPNQRCKRIIVSIDNNVIELDAPLKNNHYGNGSWKKNCKVVNLTRDIIIDAPKEDSEIDGFGCHIMVMHPKGMSYPFTGDLYDTLYNSNYIPDEVCIFEGVKIIRGGQRNILARYPFHTHMCGNYPMTAYGIITEDSYFRSITTHATNNFIKKECIAWNTEGSAFYDEEGLNKNSEYDNCIAIGVYQLKGILEKDYVQPTDRTPSGFYITNPNAKFKNKNVAVSVFGHGLWWHIKNNPDGLSLTKKLTLYNMPFGEISRDTGGQSIHIIPNGGYNEKDGGNAIFVGIFGDRTNHTFVGGFGDHCMSLGFWGHGEVIVEEFEAYNCRFGWFGDRLIDKNCKYEQFDDNLGTEETERLFLDGRTFPFFKKGMGIGAERNVMARTQKYQGVEESHKSITITKGSFNIVGKNPAIAKDAVWGLDVYYRSGGQVNSLFIKDSQIEQVMFNGKGGDMNTRGTIKVDDNGNYYELIPKTYLTAIANDASLYEFNDDVLIQKTRTFLFEIDNFYKNEVVTFMWDGKIAGKDISNDDSPKNHLWTHLPVNVEHLDLYVSELPQNPFIHLNEARSGDSLTVHIHAETNIHPAISTQGGSYSAIGGTVPVQLQTPEEVKTANKTSYCYVEDGMVIKLVCKDDLNPSLNEYRPTARAFLK